MDWIQIYILDEQAERLGLSDDEIKAAVQRLEQPPRMEYDAEDVVSMVLEMRG